MTRTALLDQGIPERCGLRAEDPPHDGPVLRVDVQPADPHPPSRQGTVGVRSGVDQAVAVGWPAAEVAGLVPGLDGHRRAHPDPGAGDLPLGQDAQQDHQFLMPGDLRVHQPAEFRDPQLHAEVFKQRCHGGELVAEEGPLAGPDHHRVERPVRIRQRPHQRGGLRSASPWQHPAVTDIEELRHDPAMPRGDPLSP
jgi:hypothetical protein